MFVPSSSSLTFPAAAWPQAPPQVPARVALDDAIRMALDRNQAIRAQRLAIEASRADQITAGLKPNLGVSFGADGFPPFAPKQINWDFLVNSVSYSSSVSYLWERGGKRRNRITVAEDTTDVTTKGVLDAERQLRFQTAQAFIGVLLAKSTLELAQENLKSFSEVVDVNRQRVTSGDLAESEFYKISLQKLQFEQDLSAAEVALIRAKATLRQLLGFEAVSEDFDINGELAYMPQTLDLEDLKRQALVERPDLQAAQSGVKLAQDSLTLEHSNKTRDLSGDLDYSHTGPANAFGIGASIDLPIHDRNQGNIANSDRAGTAGHRIRAGLPFRSHHRRRHGIRRLADQQESRRTLSVRLPRSGATVSRDQPVRLSARRRHSARPARRRAHLSRHAARRTARRWRPT